MRRNAATATTTSACFFIILLGLVFAVDVAAACECGYGTVLTTTPKCKCDCNGTVKVLPMCLLDPDGQERIQITFNDSFVRGFSAYPVEVALRSRFNMGAEGASLIYFRGTDVNGTNHLVGTFGIVARLAQAVIDDLDNNALYLQKFKIRSYTVLQVDASKAYSVIDIPIYMSVSVNTIGWLIGATVTATFLCFVECIFMTNKESDAKWSDVEELNQGHHEEHSGVIEQPVMGAATAVVHVQAHKYNSAADTTTTTTPGGEVQKESAPLPSQQDETQCAASAATASESHDDGSRHERETTDGSVHEDHEEQVPASRPMALDKE